MHLLRPAWDNAGKYLYLVFPPCPFRAIAENFIMNLVFIPVVVTLTGLFGLAFASSMASSPSKNKGEDARANNNPDSSARVRLLVPRRPFIAVLPQGVKLVSRGRTHMANVSLV